MVIRFQNQASAMLAEPLARSSRRDTPGTPRGVFKGHLGLGPGSSQQAGRPESRAVKERRGCSALSSFLILSHLHSQLTKYTQTHGFTSEQTGIHICIHTLYITGNIDAA
jgi:hypothetical protein